ncbi:MAG: hypothetical protein LC720_06305 [Actinobacteria bacterium]|nr:hypothetical protein [Actinomycetota bacterium]
MNVLPEPPSPLEADCELLTACELDWLTLPTIIVDAEADATPKPTASAAPKETTIERRIGNPSPGQMPRSPST